MADPPTTTTPIIPPTTTTTPTLPTTTPPTTTPPTTTPPTTTPPTTTPPTTTPPTTTPPTTTAPTTTTTPTPTPTPSSSSTTSVPKSSTVIVSSSSGGVITTITSLVDSSPTVTPQDNHATPFFHNKGAVAGVFTVVGLIVVAIIIALATNAVRRRRAQRFDREVDLQAAEAYKSALPPDEYHDGGAYHEYSDASGTHAAYSNAPMPMSEIYSDHTGPSYGNGDYDAYGAAGVGAAGVGAARGRRESVGTMGTAPGIAGFGAGGYGEQAQAPYHAFGDPYANAGVAGGVARGPSMRYRQATGDFPDASTMSPTSGHQSSTLMDTSSGGAGGLARGPSQHTNKSMGASDGYFYDTGTAHSPHSSGGAAGAVGLAMSPFDNHAQGGPFDNHAANQAVFDTTPSSDDHHGMGAGLEEHKGVHEPGVRQSFQDEEDYVPPRVLKVANRGEEED